MSKADTFETEILAHIFTNTAIANIGDVPGLPVSATAGSLYLGLHSASPAEGAANQSINELSYTGYARVGVVRSGLGWTVASNQVSLAANQSFGTRTDTGAAVEATFFSIGKSSAGATLMLYYGPLVGTNSAYDFTGANTGDTILVPGSTDAVDDRVVFSLGAESALPTGISDGQILYIKSAPGAGVYTLSSTPSTGANLLYAITVDGAGIVQRLSPITIAQNTTPQLTTGTKVIED